MNTCGVVSESLGGRLEYSALRGVPGRHVLPHQPLGCADHDDGDLQLLKLTSLQGLHHLRMNEAHGDGENGKGDVLHIL